MIEEHGYYTSGHASPGSGGQHSDARGARSANSLMERNPPKPKATIAVKVLKQNSSQPTRGCVPQEPSNLHY